MCPLSTAASSMLICTDLSRVETLDKVLNRNIANNFKPLRIAAYCLEDSSRLKKW
jgi:hypothetical protein